MADGFDQQRAQLVRQILHWSEAIDRMEDFSVAASPAAWDALERYVGVALRASMAESVERLRARCAALRVSCARARTPEDLRALRRRLVAFRIRYTAAETGLDFYVDALNTRATPTLGAYLRGCDVLATKSMERVFRRLKNPPPVPPVLTYVDKGLGASILKSGLRLWDPASESRVAAIKIARHNLLRPTAIGHEAGHQVAHLLRWTPELRLHLQDRLGRVHPRLGSVWASWASELAADAIGFVHAGFGGVAALHDVVSGDTAGVLRLRPRDPHPISWIRVLLGVEMCRRFFGVGPWEGMRAAMLIAHPVEQAEESTGALLRLSAAALPTVVEVLLEQRMRAFGGQSLADLVDPTEVRPDALEHLERMAGTSLRTSAAWLNQECLRMLAASSYRAAVVPEQIPTIFQEQRVWIARLGEPRAAA